MMVADTIRDIETSDSAKTWIKTLAVASSSAATLSESARSELVNVDHVIARGQAHFEYKLAEIDTHLDRAFGTILRKTESAQQSIVGPAEKLGATISGVREVVQFLSGEVERIQSGGDATPTPKT
jgi:phage-related minor tail protein